MRQPLPLTLSLTIPFILLLLSLTPLHAAGGPLLKATLLSQQPPAAPAGSIIQLHIRIENIGTERADAYSYKLILPRGSVQYTPSTEWVNTTSLDAMQVGNDGIILTYTIRLPPGVPSGTLTTVLLARKQGVTSTLARIPLTIRNPSSLAILNATLTPESIGPGEGGILHVTLANTGADPYRDVPLRVTSSILAYPEGDTRLVNLPPGETVQLTLPIRILPTTPPGYASYTIQLGNTTWTGSIRIAGRPSYTLTLEKSEDTPEGRKVTVSIANTGSMSLRHVVIHAQNATPRAVAIGRLDEDDYDTATFTLPPHAEMIEGIVTFTDAYGSEHEDTYAINLPPRAEKKRSSAPLILIIILLIIGLIAWRRRASSKLEPLTLGKR